MAKSTAMAVQAMLHPEVDPRERMKEVRSDIRMFVESGSNPWGINHVGEMYTNPEDMKRGMIALHDMLDVKTQKHNKASAHVAGLLSDLEGQDQQVFNLQTQAAVDAALIHYLDGAGEHLRGLYDEQLKQNEMLKQDMAIMKQKLDAALLTLHTVMEG